MDRCSSSHLPVHLAFKSGLALLVMIATFAVPVEAQERDPDIVYNAAKSQKAASTSEVVEALGLQPDQVSSLDFRNSDETGYTTFNTQATGFPRKGDSYLSLSTGAADVGLDPNDSPSTSGVLGGPSGPGGATDIVRMELELNVPENANTVSFDFKFFSEEFPEFVGSEFNDGFVVEVGESTFDVNGNNLSAPDNVVFDENGRPITINTTGNLGMMGTGDDPDVTYDGSTDVLTTRVPVPSGASTVTLVFSIFDVGDEFYDSAVFVDNVRFSQTPPMELAGLEVNQSIQDWQNSIPLIEDKPTLVRAHLQGTELNQSVSIEKPVGVHLVASRNGEKIGAVGGRNASDPDYNVPEKADPKSSSYEEVIEQRRADLDRSLNFNVPTDWLNGDVTFELKRADGTLDCSPSAIGEGCRTEVRFESTAEPDVVLVPVTWEECNGTVHRPLDTDSDGSQDVTLSEIRNELETMYPVTDTNPLSFLSIDVPTGIRANAPNQIVIDGTNFDRDGNNGCFETGQVTTNSNGQTVSEDLPDVPRIGGLVEILRREYDQFDGILGNARVVTIIDEVLPETTGGLNIPDIKPVSFVASENIENAKADNDISSEASIVETVAHELAHSLSPTNTALGGLLHTRDPSRPTSPFPRKGIKSQPGPCGASSIDKAPEFPNIIRPNSGLISNIINTNNFSGFAALGGKNANLVETRREGVLPFQCQSSSEVASFKAFFSSGRSS